MVSLPGEVGVNFLSSEQLRCLAHFTTIDPEDPIVEKWHLVRSDARDVIKELPWSTMTVVGASYWPTSGPRFLDTRSLRDQHPIVLVGAPEESYNSWQNMAERLYALCQASGLGHARILFQSIKHPFAATGLDNPSAAMMIHPVQLAEKVPMGSSFGPVDTNQQSAATMGGTIMLQGEDEEPKPLLLSVFHAFRHMVNQEAFSEGWHYDREQSIKLTMPSILDTSYTREYLQDRIEEDLDGLVPNLEKFEMTREEKYLHRATSCTPGLLPRYKHLRQLLANTCGTQGQGVLLYGSGFERGLDWSLSSFHGRRIDNVLPKFAIPDTFFGAVNVNFLPWRRAYEARGISTVKNRNRPEIGSLLVKCGRTTGVTAGRVNAIPADFLFQDTVMLKTTIVLEARALLTHPDARGPCSTGDSGAWFLNENGEWVGSLFADHKPKGSDGNQTVALFMDSEKIVQDIEAFTGKKVVSPGPVVSDDE